MIRLLLSSKAKHVLNLEKMIMIGRQNLHLNGGQLHSCFEEFAYEEVNGNELLELHDTFAEGVFEKMGAKEVHSLDASDYEDATIIHDLNIPLPSIYERSYDFVLDSGTLEHVFNVPEALKTCMELTKTGGHFIGIYPCNNFFGHGFYQFSSELFYRALSKENGFEILEMILFVDEANAVFYSIEDTSEVHSRVQFTNSKPVYIYVLAKRISQESIFVKAPLQMDYAAMKWQGTRPKTEVQKKKQRTLIIKMPTYLKNLAKAILNRRPASDSARFIKPFLTIYHLK